MKILQNLLILVTLVGCQSLPDNDNRAASIKRTDIQDTTLSRQAASLLKTHPDMSAFFPLTSGSEALSARLELVEAAEKSLDLQYYIWHRDESGRMLAALLIRAAERGVRVRLLLDDMGAPLGDSTLLTLHQHPNIEVRLFNPLSNRNTRAWSMLTDFARVNRRMHNKSLTADNTVSIVGGRNIGNEYFSAHQEVAFADLDLAVTGPVVDKVSDGFDLYWNHPASYAVDQLAPDAGIDDSLQGKAHLPDDYAAQARAREDYGQLLSWNLGNAKDPKGWFWGKAQVLYDHPDKALDSDLADSKLLSKQLSGTFAKVKSELLLVSPYFVPGKQGVQYFEDLEQRGVDVIIVTNSLAASDVGMVHSGYAKYRKALLKSGVELYEMRPDVERKESLQAAETEKGKEKNSPYLGSSSKASLHAKAFFIDRQYTFVGSMNLDPRSFLINTEIGILLESKEFSGLAHAAILKSLEQDAYKLELDSSGDIRWISRQGGEMHSFDADPHVSWLRRMSVWLLGLFPIESQL